ncbi:hypothetical protein BC829DRAFT_360519, partial [Chytridium lagenaria]
DFGCCAFQLMENEPDFQDEKLRIVHLLEDRGHMVLFLPKFHPELNPIEVITPCSLL